MNFTSDGILLKPTLYFVAYRKNHHFYMEYRRFLTIKKSISDEINTLNVESMYFVVYRKTCTHSIERAI
jgi:hypothetical protein